MSFPAAKFPSCALSKSTHRPVQSPSHEIFNHPGDVVAIDLVGMFAEALDGSKFALVIHDIFSRLTSVFGLQSKADAPAEVVVWIGNFEKFTPHGVKAIRSDNAGKFTS